MCIYDYAYNKINKRNVFWKYMINIHDECGNVFNEKCSKSTHELIDDLLWDDTLKCV